MCVLIPGENEGIAGHVAVRPGVVDAFGSTGRCIERHRALIAAIGEHPCGAASLRLADIQERLKHGLAQPFAAIGGRNAHFVDPEFARFIGVDVIDAARKADDTTIVDGNGDVMSVVIQKRARQRRLNRIVETSWATVSRTPSSPRLRTRMTIAIAAASRSAPPAI